MTEYSPVTPEVVAWAIDESGLSVEEIAGKLDKLKVVPADVSAWATGTEQPTRGQLTKLAETLRRPRAMFFLPEAPEADSLPDGLRKPAGERATDQRELTFDERIHVRRARYLQEFVATLVEDSPALPAADSRDDAREVAVRLRRWTGVKPRASTISAVLTAITGARSSGSAKPRMPCFPSGSASTVTPLASMASRHPRKARAASPQLRR